MHITSKPDHLIKGVQQASKSTAMDMLLVYIRGQMMRNNPVKY